MAAKRAKAAKHIARVIVPDSHGNHIDIAARDAFLRDLQVIKPQEIVFLGDHLDAGGTFSSHQRTYTSELAESYEDDVAATNYFLDKIDEISPDSDKDYLEGNHCQHVARWAARNAMNKADADMIVRHLGPEAVLRLKQRGIRYYRRDEFYQGISIPGCIKRGRVFFVHGISHSKNASAVHLARFGANVVHGHTHRSQSVVERTVTSQGHGAWCPGTLAKLQPLYKHTEPSSWAHGYGLQFVNQSTGTFAHWNVPILRGVSLLKDTIDYLSKRRS